MVRECSHVSETSQQICVWHKLIAVVGNQGDASENESDLPLTHLILTSASTSCEELQKIRIRIKSENKNAEYVIVDPGDKIQISRAPVRYGTDFSELLPGHYVPKPLDAVFYYFYSPRMPEYTPRVTYLS